MFGKAALGRLFIFVVLSIISVIRQNRQRFNKRDGQTITLGYDNLNRLISRSYPDPALNIGFAYDLMSHRTAARYTNGTRNYTSNGLNQYINAAGAPVTYDPKANLATDGTWTYTYDADNHLTSANKSTLSATLLYDPIGRLRQRATVGTTNLTIQSLYDGVNLIAEYDAANLLQRRFVHGPGVDEPLVQYEGVTTTNKSWFYADHQGSVVATADSAGVSTGIYSYGPYGEPSMGGPARFQYTGQQYFADLGLYYYEVQLYSPTLGKFMQTDPIGYASDLNLYAYVGGNPVNLVDPDGKLAFFWHFGITYAAARDSGMGFADSLALAWNTMMVDKGTQSTAAFDANVHAMLGTKANGEYQSLAEGQQAINGIIANGAQPTAIHTTQDAATPDHYLEEWRGAGWNLETVTHLLHDTFPSADTITNAYSNTMNVLSKPTTQQGAVK